MRIVGLVAAVAALASIAVAQDTRGIRIGQICPDFTLKTVDGKEEVSIADFRKDDKEKKEGQFVAVTFWSFKCPTGKNNMSNFKQISEFCKENDIAFLGICSYGESRKKLKAFADDNGVEYTLLFDGETSVAQKLGAECVTESFVFDKDGKCVYMGALNKSRRAKGALLEALKEIAAGKEVSVQQTRARG